MTVTATPPAAANTSGKPVSALIEPILDELDASGERTFASGSRGFHGNGKITMNGKKYTVNVLVVEVGSKPGSNPAKRS